MAADLPAATLLLIRHTATDWNLAGRIQGQSDVPLSAAGLAAAGRWRLPGGFTASRWWSSPLARAVQTAWALGAGSLSTDPRLAEMRWGEWEGLTLASIRERGQSVRDNEARGLDFRPPGGETPREVQQRLLGWCGECATGGERLVVVTHKGVIRAALAAACGWDMRGKPPHRLAWDRAHEFSFDAQGLRLHAANQPLGT